MIKRTLIFALTTTLLAFGMAGCDYARAQGARVVQTCGTLPLAYAPGGPRDLVQDVNGTLCTSATLSGGVTIGNINLNQILGAAPSATNPLWVAASNGASFPVTGTFWQTTQPVSIASMPSTPVTGTFWQTTQPVSMAVGPTTPVTGTFWQATQPVSISAAPLNAIGITPTDRTITSATGASQTVAAANGSRHGLIVENTGSANCGVNPTGGTAAIGGAGTLTLTPQGSYQPRIPTLSAVTAICTAGQTLYAEEN